uniref:Queuosine 5'-phosphate N-glycosylase/hydrolase n=1 Tax=Trichuris muris TaxID=70415 RepID=A0A5S6QLV7_TRIMR
MQTPWNCDYLTENNILDPWASIAYISKNAQYVQLCDERLEETAETIFKKIASGDFEEAFIRPAGLHVYNEVKLSLRNSLDRWCFACTMSFSFWSDYEKGMPRYIVKDRENRFWKGGRAIMVRLNHLIECGIAVSADAFEIMPFSVFNFFLMDRRAALPPMMEERYKAVIEVATVLNKKFHGSFYNCVTKANNDPMKLMSLVLENFPSFRDIVDYNGKKVSFLMKAQLLVLGVSVLLEESKGVPVMDCSNFILSTTNRDVQMAIYYGGLVLSSGVENRVKDKDIFEYGEPAEVEMRAMTSKCMQLLADKINSKLESSEKALRIDYLDIDSIVDMDRVWNIAKLQRGQIIYPRTRCLENVQFVWQPEFFTPTSFGPNLVHHQRVMITDEAVFGSAHSSATTNLTNDISCQV